MSIIAVDIGRNEATGHLAELHEQLTSDSQKIAFMKAVGVRAEGELRAWFLRRDQDSPNKHGWPRQHFWTRIARKTAFDPSKTTPDTATVVVSDPALAAKVNGATIRPTGAVSPATGKPTQNIAIPMQAAAYGNWPRAGFIPKLFFLRKTNGNGGFLVTAEGTGKSRQLTFWYRLLPEVTVPKDPQALPPKDTFGDALVDTAIDFFQRRGGSN